MFSLALKLCQKSNHVQHHHATIITQGGAIVAMGYNHGETHSETNALKKLWPSHRKGVKVYNFRFTKSGKWSMSKPCPNCEKFLRDNGVKVVYYTDNTGELVKMRM